MGKAVLLLSVLASALAAPETRFLCSECVDEMHNLGFLVKMGARDIRDYLAANYCPTVESSQQDFCVEKLARYYIGMLDAIVHHYFMDPVMIAEYVIYLEQNFCQDGWEGCKEHAIQDFPAMHMMAMEKFFIPVEICNGQEVCGAPPPTKPPQ